jgi:hypothetical protein
VAGAGGHACEVIAAVVLLAVAVSPATLLNVIVFAFPPPVEYVHEPAVPVVDPVAYGSAELVGSPSAAIVCRVLFPPVRVVASVIEHPVVPMYD